MAKLSACLIVKNEEEFLPRTLPSLMEGADEVIVVDTGSTDRTVEIAKKLGAKVYHYPWNNDFAAARNEALKYAACDWILWIDADEYVKAGDLVNFKKFIDTVQDKVICFSLPIYEVKLGVSEPQGLYYLRIKIFRNNLGIKFERLINENPSLPQGVSGQNIFLKDFPIYHWGLNASPEKLREKDEARAKLYEKMLEAHPEDPNLHFMLGLKYQALGQIEKAAQEYERVMALGKELVIEAHLRKAEILFSRKKFDEVVALCEEALKKDPQAAEIRVFLGKTFIVLKKFEAAIKAVENITEPGQRTIVDLSSYNFWPYFIMGVGYVGLKDYDRAIPNLKKALEVQPDNKEVKGLLEVLNAC